MGADRRRQHWDDHVAMGPRETETCDRAVTKPVPRWKILRRSKGLTDIESNRRDLVSVRVQSLGRTAYSHHRTFTRRIAGTWAAGAIRSDGRRDEADAVAVRGPDDEVASSPRLLLELLVERRASRHVLGVERFHVLDLDEGGDESIPVLRASSEHGLVHEFEMYTGTVARYGAVERRLAVQEVDGETQSIPEELGRRLHVDDQDHRHGARESRRGRHGFGERGRHGSGGCGLVGNSDLQRRPARV